MGGLLVILDKKNGLHLPLKYGTLDVCYYFQYGKP